MSDPVRPRTSGDSVRAFLVSGFGSGYAPVASGTFGSAVAIAISLVVWQVARWTNAPAGTLDIAWVILALLASVVCVALGKWACVYYADRCRKPGDPGHVVLDEFAGQWVSLLLLPLGGPVRTLVVFAVQFFLFRFFDVLKAPPAKQLEHLPHGWGILLDDVAAGVCANLVGQLIFRFFWP